MGVFDFIKKAGAGLFSGDDDQAEKIQELLTSELGDDIVDLSVEFDDGVVSLSGVCANQAVKEKAILLAGNVEDVEQVNDDEFSIELQPLDDKVETEEFEEIAEPEPKFYTIQKGDTLSKIAKEFYGNAMKYPELFEANKEVIKDPDLIYPGQVIRVPEIE